MIRSRTLKFIAVALWVPLCSGAQKKFLEPAISPLSAEMKAASIGKSWNEGCPVSLDDLALVRVMYLGFDGLAHEGKLVVQKRIAEDVVSVFGDLYKAHFPFRGMGSGTTTVRGSMRNRTSQLGLIARKRPARQQNGAATRMAWQSTQRLIGGYPSLASKSRLPRLHSKPR
jgi:hypothetical protein